MTNKNVASLCAESSRRRSYFLAIAEAHFSANVNALKRKSENYQVLKGSYRTVNVGGVSWDYCNSCFNK